MGSGKTTATINYIITHPDEKYLYITPYNEECERIAVECTQKGVSFKVAKNNNKKTEFSKTKYLKAELEMGNNIAISHSLFKRCDGEMLSIIKDKGYIVFIDEVLQVFEPYFCKKKDLEAFIKLGYINVDEDKNGIQKYTVTEEGNTYGKGGIFFGLLNLIKYEKLYFDTKTGISRWSINEKLFSAAKETFILTYLFEGSVLSGFLKMN